LSWTSTKSAARIAAAGVAALTLINVSAAYAGTIVVKSTAKSYPPGKAIADNSKVSLKAGEIVTILDGRGTRVLKGPGVFSTTASTGTSSSIGALLNNTGTRQVRTGAVRGTGTSSDTRPPNLWMIDATKSGSVCYAGGATLSLWSPKKEQASTMTVTRLSDGKAVRLNLVAGQSVKVWPVTDLPVADGGSFRISGAAAQPATVRFIALGPNPQGLEGTAAALIKAGCASQLDLLVETVAQPAEETATVG